MITLAEIIHGLGATQVIGGLFPLPETVIDSRNVIPGALFIALEGENTDGHLYLAQAFQKGATAAIISKELPQFVDQTIDLRTAEISTIDLSNYSQPYCGETSLRFT